MIATICGYVGTVGLIFMLLPQLHHIYKTKDASGTAWGFIALQYVVSINYIVYGVSLHALPIIISNGGNLISVLCITGCKLTYDDPTVQEKNDSDKPSDHPLEYDGMYGTTEL